LLGGVAAAGQDRGQAQPGIDLVAQPRALLQMTGCRIRLPQPIKNPCKVVVVSGIVRHQIQTSTIGVDGLGIFTDIGQCISGIRVVCSVGLAGSNETIEGP